MRGLALEAKRAALLLLSLAFLLAGREMIFLAPTHPWAPLLGSLGIPGPESREIELGRQRTHAEYLYKIFFFYYFSKFLMFSTVNHFQT